jgi:leucyl aminopeptidase
MKCSAFSNPEKRPRTDLCLLPFAQGEEGEPVALFDDPVLLRSCQHLLQTKDFSGKEEEIIYLYPDPILESRVCLVGLGPKKALHVDQIRLGYAKAVHSLPSSVAFISSFPPMVENLSLELVFRGVLEGIYLGMYTFDMYRTDKKEKKVREVALLCEVPSVYFKMEKEVRAKMEAVAFARDLVNQNADDIDSEGFAACAKKLDDGRLRIQIHEKEWIERERMNLFLAVARAASKGPRFIIAEWKGAPHDSDHTALVGKGITFDSGGLNIKTGNLLEGMKGDMAGAAAVLAVMKALRDLNVPVNVTAAIPLCENGIDARAYKPGDVVISRSGITVEVINTDAEGRLILADALDYVKDVIKPSRIIDVATLTGSAEIAVGKDIAAVFSNADALAFQLETAGTHAGDPMWQMPLHKEYDKLLKSEIADCKSLAGRSGGAIIAALFLQKFVGEIPWAHIDIAGPSDVLKPVRYYEYGATGVPVRSLIEFFLSMSSKEEREEIQKEA